MQIEAPQENFAELLVTDLAVPVLVALLHEGRNCKCEVLLGELELGLLKARFEHVPNLILGQIPTPIGVEREEVEPELIFDRSFGEAHEGCDKLLGADSAIFIVVVRVEEACDERRHRES